MFRHEGERYAGIVIVLIPLSSGLVFRQAMGRNQKNALRLNPSPFYQSLFFLIHGGGGGRTQETVPPAPIIRGY